MVFSETNLSKKPTLLSAGVGEDVSFDIEILNNFSAKVYFVDPLLDLFLILIKLLTI